MNKMLKTMKSCLPFSCAIAFVLFLLCPIALKASSCQVTFEEPNTSSTPEKEIKERIRSYLTSNSYYPIFTNSDMQYEVSYVFEESGTVYTLGYLSQGETCVLAVFSIEKGWFSTTTNMLYMATDTPPSPLLFKNVCSLAEQALPNRLSNYHVLIQKYEDPSIGGYLQIWAFYNQVEWIELLVSTVPTLDGGTDFTVMVPQQ